MAMPMTHSGCMFSGPPFLEVADRDTGHVPAPENPFFIPDEPAQVAGRRDVHPLK